MSAPESADHVSVHLTDCGHEDANVVFGALETAFPEGTGPARSETRASRSTADNPVIWCTIVDARTRSDAVSAPAPLSGAVTVDLFGPAHPVRQVQQKLAAVFDVEEHGTVSGEHEVEIRLKLTPLSTP
ncbi:hypothetical protein SNS2_4286 [Streptomyces netropsis]|uniref:DUF3168 domain-containing protein n=1 Tax=Streptomyces syringium TaxID=76729 RepID=A0ABS4YDW4_9ACTN|nr:hypothetical protein [Streptomyces syringium]MBP2406845.1 hypothetical protein [Streptomyces syringium]SPE61964.1 hypothetical protein SNS2_4286 [Streptomyces netropsis]